MRRRSNTSVDDHRQVALLDDDMQHVLVFDALVGPDRRCQRHNGGGTGLLELLAGYRVGLDVGKHHKTLFYKHFGGDNSLTHVGKQVFGVGVDFEFYPVGASGNAAHLGCKHPAHAVFHALQLHHGWLRQCWRGTVGALLRCAVLGVEAFESRGNHLAARGFDSLFHHLVRRELARSDKKPRTESPVGDF